MTDIYPIHGYCAPGYEAVRDAFIDNFTREEEIGAGFCAMRDGVAVVDLYGGYADRKKTRNWERDTIVPVFSSTKAVAAIVIAHLADADKLSYNQKVASRPSADLAARQCGRLSSGHLWLSGRRNCKARRRALAWNNPARRHLRATRY